MKALIYISFLVLTVISSCTSSLYTGSEYDDLYYTSSDKPSKKSSPSAMDQVNDNNQGSEIYYDNIYAADTLVSDEYSDAVDYNDQLTVANSSGSGYTYYDDYSYTNRISTFYGNYFYPYWRDPYYFGFGYSPYGISFGIGFGFGYPYYSYGYPYYGYGYGYPYYGYGGYYDYYPYYGYGYPPYYGGYRRVLSF